jgi:hypothetical protein
MTPKRQAPADYLAAAPKDVRARMLAPQNRLEPGAAAAVGRFFRIVSERGEPVAAPSRESFGLAAASEPTLGTLLRALAKFAPQMCLAGGREARAGWYARRAGGQAPRRKGPGPLPLSAPTTWPAPWATLYPRLLAAAVEESTLRRYIASINRCAAALPWTDAQPDWSRYMAYSLVEVFEEEGLRPVTIAGYLDGLIGLGKHGRLPDATLDGLCNIRSLTYARAAAADKLKVPRIEDFTERGGIRSVAEAIGRLRSDAASLPASAAAAERMRRTAAILAVELVAYARTGDVASWVMGDQLVRYPCGTWHLEWTQGKTGKDRAPGELWPEVGEVLDELILAGRPHRYAALRYQRLVGMNWLTHTRASMPSRQPSFLVREVLGVPLHDLRTVIADLMRRVDPATARRLIAALLGHASLEAGEEYRALCEGDVASRGWSRMRGEIIADPTRLLAQA